MNIDLIGKLARRWKLWLIALVTGAFLLFLVAAWTVFPWSDRVTTQEYPNGTIVRVEETRHYQYLPPAKWGFSSSTMIGCGDKICIMHRFTRLGFFEMTDMKREIRLPN